MKIYTRTGDKGTTSLYGGTRVPKSHLRVEAYGALDELNASIGLIRVKEIPQDISTELLEIQNNLFTLGAELATMPDKLFLENGGSRLPSILTKKNVENLEKWIDKHTKLLPPLSHFILPGGEVTNAYCHLARTVCRRAERIVVALSEHEEVRDENIMYLNRLSDYLFTLARRMSGIHNKEEIEWKP